MGVAGGPNIERDGLVFGYDTGYSDEGKNLSRGRYFNGPASANILEVLNTSYTDTQNANFYAVAGEETVNIPKIGKRSVKYVEYFNNRYDENGNVNSGTTCCPNLFRYFDGSFIDSNVESSTSYTYSIIYKHTNNYTHPNFMYRYEYNSSGTRLTEGGLHSTSSSRRRHLGRGWYHAWGTFTTQATTTKLRGYSFLYNYGTTKYKFYVAAISLVKNTSGETHLIIPPHLMLEPGTSISSTNSLIDLTKSTNVDVSNVSFDSTGQHKFDGTDDYIDLPNPGVASSPTFTTEFIIKVNDYSTQPIFISPNSVGIDHFFRMNAIGKLYARFVEVADSSADDYVSTTTISTSNYYHIVMSKSPSNGTLYVNGVSEDSHTPTLTSAAWSGNWRIGRRSNGTYHFNGELPVLKVYNRALTATEVQKNFKAYKNRFNI